MSRQQQRGPRAASVLFILLLHPFFLFAQVAPSRVPPDFRLPEVFPHSRLLIIATDGALPGSADEFAVRDAMKLRDLLCDRYGFQTGNVVTLADERACRDSLLHTLDSLGRACGTNDRLIVIYSGPAGTDENGTPLLFHETRSDGSASSRSMPLRSFIDQVKMLPARQILVLINAPAMPADTTTPYAQPGRDSSWFYRTVRERVVSVIGAAGSIETNRLQPGFRSGLFMYRILEGLRSSGADMNDDGVITWSELTRYLKMRVLMASEGNQHVWCAQPDGPAGAEAVLIPAPLIARIPVTSSPTRARVAIDDQPAVQTPAMLDLRTYGSHEIRVDRTEYLPDTLRFTTEAIPESLHVSLLPSTEFVFESRPGGADVWVDDVFIGRTPARVLLERKDVRVRMTREFCFPWNATLHPMESPLFVTRQELRRKPGTLIPDGSPLPVSLEFEREDSTFTIDPKTYDPLVIPRGMYALSIRRPGYVTEHQALRMDSIPVSLTFALQARSRFLGLASSALVPGAGQIINGRETIGGVLIAAHIVAVRYIIAAYTDADRETKSYWSARRDYDAAVSLGDIASAYDRMTRAYDNRTAARKRFTIAASIGGAIWLANMIDAFLFDAAAGETVPAVRLSTETSRITISIPL